MFRKRKDKSLQDSVTIPSNGENWYNQGMAAGGGGGGGYNDDDGDIDIPIGAMGDMALAAPPPSNSRSRTRASFSIKSKQPTTVPHTPDELCSAVGARDWHEATRIFNEDPSCVSQQAAVTLRGQNTKCYPVHLIASSEPPPDFLDRVVQQNPGALLSGDRSMSRSPLHWACIGNAEPQVLQILTNANPAACKQQDRSHNRTPLHYLAMHGSDEIQINILMNADQRAAMTKDRDSKTPVELAESSTNPFKLDIIPALQQKRSSSGGVFGRKSRKQPMEQDYARSASPGKYGRGTSPGKYGRGTSPGKYGRGTSPGKYSTPGYQQGRGGGGGPGDYAPTNTGERGRKRSSRVDRSAATNVAGGAGGMAQQRNTMPHSAVYNPPVPAPTSSHSPQQSRPTGGGGGGGNSSGYRAPPPPRTMRPDDRTEQNLRKMNPSYTVVNPPPSSGGGGGGVSGYQAPPPPRTMQPDAQTRIASRKQNEGGGGPVANTSAGNTQGRVSENLGDDLNQNILDLKQQQQERRNEIEQKDMEISQIDQQLSEIARQEDRLNIEIQQAQAGRANEEEIYHKQSRISSIQQQIADLQAELRHLEGEIRSLQNAGSSNQYEISRKESRLRSLEDEKMTFRAIREALDEERSTAKRDFDNIDGEIKSLEAIQTMAMNDEF